MKLPRHLARLGPLVRRVAVVVLFLAAAAVYTFAAVAAYLYLFGSEIP